jgi:Rrf2 family protein
MDNTQFSIAVHLMAGLGANAGKGIPSAQLARSVNTSPSFIRRVVSKLARAGLIRTTTGKAGACMLTKDIRTITLLDIYRAVEAPKVFAIHRYPVRRDCAISCGIKATMDKVLDSAQQSMEAGLRKVVLSDVLADLK